MLRQIAASVYGLVAGLRFRARRGKPGTMRAGEAELYYDARTSSFRYSNSDGDNAFGGSGGGVSAHTALTALAWTSSGHTGTGIAGFDGGGAAAYYAIGTDLQAYHANLAAIAAGTWTGAASITTLGTIGTGVWQGTTVAAGYGGTGATSLTDLSVSGGGLIVDKARGLRETSGPTTLTMGAVAAGQLLRRVGNTIVGAYILFATLPPPQSGPYNVLVGTTTGEAFTGSTWV